MQRPDLIQQLYQQTAPHYEANIAPIMRHFALDMIQTARISTTDVVLDVGTGTGVLAREITGLAHQVIGIDISMSFKYLAIDIVLFDPSNENPANNIFPSD